MSEKFQPLGMPQLDTTYLYKGNIIVIIVSCIFKITTRLVVFYSFVSVLCSAEQSMKKDRNMQLWCRNTFPK